MPTRRNAVLGLLAALGWGTAAAKCDRKCRGVRRVRWCYAHPDKAVRCSDHPPATCQAYIDYALAACCPKAKQGWAAFDRCLYA